MIDIQRPMWVLEPNDEYDGFLELADSPTDGLPVEVSQLRVADQPKFHKTLMKMTQCISIFGHRRKNLNETIDSWNSYEDREPIP